MTSKIMQFIEELISKISLNTRSDLTHIKRSKTLTALTATTIRAAVMKIAFAAIKAEFNNPASNCKVGTTQMLNRVTNISEMFFSKRVIMY